MLRVLAVKQLARRRRGDDTKIIIATGLARADDGITEANGKAVQRKPGREQHWKQDQGFHGLKVFMNSEPNLCEITLREDENKQAVLQKIATTITAFRQSVQPNQQSRLPLKHDGGSA